VQIPILSADFLPGLISSLTAGCLAALVDARATNIDCCHFDFPPSCNHVLKFFRDDPPRIIAEPLKRDPENGHPVICKKITNPFFCLNPMLRTGKSPNVSQEIE